MQKSFDSRKNERERLEQSKALNEKIESANTIVSSAIRNLLKQAAGSLLTSEDREAGPDAIQDLVKVMTSAQALLEALDRLATSRTVFSRDDVTLGNKIVEMIVTCKSIRDLETVSTDQSEPTNRTITALKRLAGMLFSATSVFTLDEDLNSIEHDFPKLIDLDDFRKMSGLTGTEEKAGTEEKTAPRKTLKDLPLEPLVFAETLLMVNAVRAEEPPRSPIDPSCMSYTLPVPPAPNSSNIPDDFHNQESRELRHQEAEKNISNLFETEEERKEPALRPKPESD